jgi:GDSL-like Lipase/Acylhydrolase family
VMKRRILFALAAIVLAFGLAVAVLFLADLLLHRRAERSAGLNVWGYRGHVVSRRHDGPRVAVLGGSTAFGYGVTWDQALPAALERELKSSAPEQDWSVVNLGYNNEGAYSFRFTLEDFGYLRPDLVVFYEGYNDMAGDDGPNKALFRHASPVFVLTGYMPILPLIFHEKALALRHGSLDAAYAHEQGKPTVVFTPNLGNRTAASALDAAVLLEQSIERQLKPLAEARVSASAALNAEGCVDPWRHFCHSVAVAVEYALSRHQKVIVAGQPRPARDKVADRHAEQQLALITMLQRKFGANADVRYVDLRQAVDLRDPGTAPDSMHLNGSGNRRLAEKLVPQVLDMLGAAPARSVS